MKTLIIVSHPDIAHSSNMQFLLASLEGEAVEVHHLDAILADSTTGHFDREAEWKMIQEAERIILQFPLYWYQAPAVMKQWIDEVFHHGDYSAKIQKELGIVVAIGAKESEYQPGASVGFTMAEILRPYQALANHLGWKYLSPFAIYQFSYMTESEKQQLLVDYLYYIESRENSFDAKEKWLLERIPQFQGEHWEQIHEWILENRHEREELKMMLAEMRK